MPDTGGLSRAERAAESVGDQVQAAVVAAVEASDVEIEHLSAATLDYLLRIGRASLAVQAALARGHIAQAARATAQLAALANMADARMRVAAERRIATLAIADQVLGAVPGGRGTYERSRAAAQARYRSRSG